MKILVLNCGSSSIKYQLLDMQDKPVKLVSGAIERIGFTDSIIKFSTIDGKSDKRVEPIESHSVGIKLILNALISDEIGALKSISELSAVGHRVAHGGELFSKAVLVNSDVKDGIKNCIPLAPLHNPANLKGIETLEDICPEIPQVAVFDTSFHQTISKEKYMYPLASECYDIHKIRKYGFHGTSHKFVAEKASELVGKKFEDLKIISCHLGNGASITAIKDGKSFDTSMGFTPLDGIMMGTRSGSIDPGVVLYLMDQVGLDSKQVSELLNSKSGVYGVSGVSSDMRDLAAAKDLNNENAHLAFNMYVHRIKHFIGAYVANMNGVDLIIFTGGIGENRFLLRDAVCSDLEYLGIKMNSTKNSTVISEDAIVSANDSLVDVTVICTDEELVIAKETMTLCENIEVYDKVLV